MKIQQLFMTNILESQGTEGAYLTKQKLDTVNNMLSEEKLRFPI